MSEIRNISSYTEEERKLIDSAYAKNMLDLTPDETAIIIEWEKSKAISEQSYLDSQALMEQEINAKIEIAKAEHNRAMTNLQTLTDMAVERLNRLLSTDTILNVNNIERVNYEQESEE